MGTRSLVHVKEAGKNSKTLITIYRQYDGYPTGMGDDIVQILNGGDCKLVNGYGADESPAVFNGMGCLAAYLVGALKDGRIGNVYIYPADSVDVNEEYVYTLYVKDGKVFMSIVGCATDDEEIDISREDIGKYLSSLES